jgi:uncharacterized protein YndB with AHSA1/START domain
MKRVSFDMEFIFKASPGILYKFLTSNDCLVRWFCDGCDLTGETYVFEWEGSEEVAELVDDIEEERIRFIFEDAEDGEYLEFRMYKAEMTLETILEITDFCDEDEVDGQRQFWDTQIANLRIACGS